MSGINDMLELSTQIIRPIIYYIPKGTFAEVEEKYAEELKTIKLIGTLMLLDVNGEPHIFNNRIEQIELLKKEKKLKTITLKLIESKVKYDKETFLYQLKDYLHDLDLWVKTTDFIRKNAKVETSNYFDEIQPYLDLQYDVLTEHQTELKQRFAKIMFEPLQNQELNINKVDLSKPTLTGSEKTKHDKKQKRKLALPSDTEVDQYLLETVFGVDFLKINNQKR